MRCLAVIRKSGLLASSEFGVTLVETLVALAILGVVAVTFLNGLIISSKAVSIADEQAVAGSLARNQMEWLKTVDYVYGATEYSPAPMPDGKDYINYLVTIAVEPLHIPDMGIQRVIVTVKRSGEAVVRLEGYKVDR
jgi:prepilin-type N-terminal cleavage/methylation domain-containing protein